MAKHFCGATEYSDKLQTVAKTLTISVDRSLPFLNVYQVLTLKFFCWSTLKYQPSMSSKPKILKPPIIKNNFQWRRKKEITEGLLIVLVQHLYKANHKASKLYHSWVFNWGGEYCYRELFCEKPHLSSNLQTHWKIRSRNGRWLRLIFNEVERKK